MILQGKGLIPQTLLKICSLSVWQMQKMLFKVMAGKQEKNILLMI